MENINQEHPEYIASKAMWRRYGDLYAGGEALRLNASSYLVSRHKEPGEIYLERLNRVFYENYIGSIIDWYAATLMRREPVITVEGADESGRQFVNLLAEDCDRRGTNFAEFFRRQFVHMLVYGKSYTVIDFPKAVDRPTNRAEEDALGQSRAYLVEYSPEEVINWGHSDDGTLDWAVIRTSCWQQTSVSDGQPAKQTMWYYFDRQRYQVYRKRTGAKAQAPDIELLDEGVHGLAKQQRVPLFEMKVTDGLWLMNKAALLQLEHFNKSNALSWALTMGLFATPVVYSDREWNQIVGESYYIQLGPEDKFGWTEPQGHVYQIAVDNLSRLKDEIYRICYLLSQAGDSGSIQMQSGLSKQRDFTVTQEVLRAYGDAVKETMKQVLSAIRLARQDDLAIEVSGLDQFDIGDFGEELDDAKKLLELGVGSDTLKRQLFKKLAFKCLCDVSQETKARIAQEIDESFEKRGEN